MTNKEKALLVAGRVHANQRYDIFPYIYHIKRVVAIAEKLHYDESIIVACALHDSLEDTDLAYDDIVKFFGLEVAEIVFAVTDELGKNRKEKKEKTYAKIRNNWKAVAVKICDRIANVSHSMEYSDKHIDMYRKEHTDFYNNIHNPEHPEIELRKAWNKLHITLGL